MAFPELSAMWRGEVTSRWLGLAIAPVHGHGRGDSVIVLQASLSRLISSPVAMTYDKLCMHGRLFRRQSQNRSSVV